MPQVIEMNKAVGLIQEYSNYIMLCTPKISRLVKKTDNFDSIYISFMLETLYRVNTRARAIRDIAKDIQTPELYVESIEKSRNIAVKLLDILQLAIHDHSDTKEIDESLRTLVVTVKRMQKAIDQLQLLAKEDKGVCSNNFMVLQKDALKKMIFLERTEAKDLNAEYRATMLESVLKLLYENENN